MYIQCFRLAIHSKPLILALRLRQHSQKSLKKAEEKLWRFTDTNLKKNSTKIHQFTSTTYQ